jgi:hypothetical protein
LAKIEILPKNQPNLYIRVKMREVPPLNVIENHPYLFQAHPSYLWQS